MKRLLAIILAAIMLFSFTACSPNSEEPSITPEPGQPTEAPEADDNERIRIGMIISDNTNPMTATFYAWARHAAELLNVELVWYLNDTTVDAQRSACEQLITAGCKGIFFVPADTPANTILGNLCRDAGIYWAVSNRDIADEDVKASAYLNPYFAVHVRDENYNFAKKLIDHVAEQGIRNVCLITGSNREPASADRNYGFLDECESKRINVLDTIQADASPDAIKSAVSRTLSNYPETEAIVSVNSGNGIGEAVISALGEEEREPGSVKFATFGTFTGCTQAFEDGWMLAASDGYVPEALMAFLVLVNRVRGRITPDGTIKLRLAPIMITSAEDMRIFSRNVHNPSVFLFSDELILEMVTPGCDQAFYQSMLNLWNMDFVKDAIG